MDRQTLTISAERNAPTGEDVNWIRRERWTGRVMRRFALGRRLDVSAIAAAYDDGVLRIEIPVSEAAKPRRISPSRPDPSLHQEQGAARLRLMAGDTDTRRRYPDRVVAFADKPLLHFTAADEWEHFLENDPPDGGVRLLLLKNAATVPGIRYAEALDVALCFGWIDGQVARHDADFTQQAFTPRRRASPWSQINRGHVERLSAAGRIRPAGLAEIDRARADGRWDAAYRIQGATVPDDLRGALDSLPDAAAAFETLNAQNRWAILFRLSQLKRPETRARRIAEYVAMLAHGGRLYP